MNLNQSLLVIFSLVSLAESNQRIDGDSEELTGATKAGWLRVAGSNRISKQGAHCLIPCFRRTSQFFRINLELVQKMASREPDRSPRSVAPLGRTGSEDPVGSTSFVPSMGRPPR